MSVLIHCLVGACSFLRARAGSLSEMIFHQKLLPAPFSRGRPLRDRSCLVAAHAPSDPHNQSPVLVAQAPGEEVTLPFVSAVAALGNPFGEPLA